MPPFAAALDAFTDATRRALRPPGQCECCRGWAPRALCDDCIARHAAPAARCRTCALRLPSGALRCGPCQQDPPSFDAVRCVADYGFPWDGLIHAFKFHDRVDLAGPLADALQRALGADAEWPELIVPVPLASARLRERGYNQAWALARHLGARLRRPAMADALLRPIDGAHQVNQGRAARQRQMRGAFIAPRPQRLAGRRIALVDDVLTTGATAAEAARVLRQAGAAAVQVWVVARTA